jgi:hypothetical protein
MALLFLPQPWGEAMKSWWAGQFLPRMNYSDHVGRAFAKVLCSPTYKRRAANDPPVEHWGWMQ